MKKRLVLAALLLALAVSFSGFAAQGAENIFTAAQIDKYGNVVLSVSGTDFLSLGYAYGDMLRVELGDSTYEMPVCFSYADVQNGAPVCRVETDRNNGGNDVKLALNMSDLATASGLGVKETTQAEPGYIWHFAKDAPVTVTLAVPGGYLEQLSALSLVYTHAREDYPHLTDAQFANFREITAGHVGAGALYRSASPVNPQNGRSTYADAAMREAGVRTVVNLTDTQADMHAYDGFAESYYARCAVLPLSLGMDYHSESFRQSLAEGLRFIAANPGPYLIHCEEGKDRAGFVSALLECLMGATANEVVADYMTTYENYYGIVPGTEQYSLIADSNICKILAAAFGVENIAAEGVQLQAEAEAYMTEMLGLKMEEVEALKARLRGET